MDQPENEHPKSHLELVEEMLRDDQPAERLKKLDEENPSLDGLIE